MSSPAKERPRKARLAADKGRSISRTVHRKAGVWVLTRGPGGSGWVVSHEPTGMSLAGGQDDHVLEREAADALMDTLDASPDLRDVAGNAEFKEGEAIVLLPVRLMGGLRRARSVALRASAEARGLDGAY